MFSRAKKNQKPKKKKHLKSIHTNKKEVLATSFKVIQGEWIELDM